MKIYVNILLLGLMWITAYHSHHLSALGTHPRLGICAVSHATGIKLKSRVKIGKRWYTAEDYCKRGIDVWLPTEKECKHWGRQRLPVRVGRVKR